jgi:hypothetical protein
MDVDLLELPHSFILAMEGGNGRDLRYVEMDEMNVIIFSFSDILMC